MTAAAVLITVPPVGRFVFVQRHLVVGFVALAVKG
jgi:ABC-type glycerol-3-phosphate transport system permease component